MNQFGIEAARHRNDFLNKLREVPPMRSIEDVERSIRASMRTLVHSEIQWLMPKGQRGKGRSNPIILDRIQYWRLCHSESIRRQYR